MQQDVFCALSGDLNPLHRDTDYARRTPFGQTVVYGMALVLVALGHWARGRPFRLKRLEGRFRKPVFAGNRYGVEIREVAPGSVEARWVRGEDALCATLRWEGQLVAALQRPERGGRTTSPNGTFVRVEARRRSEALPPSGRFATYPYAFAGRDLVRIGAFGLQPEQVETRVLQAIFGLSFLAGMELPGEPALLVEFSCEFEERAARPTSDAFLFRDLEWTCDPRFGAVAVAGRATGVSALRLGVMSRPAPVEITLNSIEKIVGRSSRLRDETVFVTGAARGFGSVVARALALHGADVIANVRADSPEATALIREMVSAGLQARLTIGDAADGAALRARVSDLIREGTRLTGLVLNAYPPIRDERFSDQTSNEFAHEVLAGIRLTVVPLEILLPVLSHRGWVVSVSSEYVTNPRAGFSHYVASKAAIEGLFQTLAAEFPQRRFAVFRAPRMLTDQTNGGVSPAALESAAECAAHLLQQLGDPGDGRPGFERWAFHHEPSHEL